jgi:GGDEF domain-containing protein
VSEHPGAELSLLEATVAAQRAVLRARRPDDVVAALERTVHALGGQVVPGHVSGDEVLHTDLSLGVRDPMLPWAPPDDPARAALQRVLPPLLEDARRQVHLLWAREDVGDPSFRDELTGALHANATARLVGRSATDDTVVGFGAGGMAAIQEVHGTARVEVLLRQLAGFVRSELDVDERLGRLVDPALVVVLPRAEPGRAAELTDRVAARWQRQRAVPVPLLHATATIGPDAHATLAALAVELRDDALSDVALRRDQGRDDRVRDDEVQDDEVQHDEGEDATWADQPTDRATDRTPGRTTDRTTGRTSGQAPGPTGEPA